MSLSHSMAVKTPDGNRFGWRCAHVVWRMFDCAKPYVFSNFPKFLKPKAIQKRIGENGFIRLKGHPMICFSESAFFYSLGVCKYIYIYIQIFFIYEKFQGSNVDSMLQLMLCVPFVLLDKSFRLKACWSKILTIYIYMYAACHFWIFWILFLSIFFPLGPTIDWGTGPAWLVDWQQWKFWCFKVRNNSRLTWPVSSKGPTAFSDPLWTYLRTGPSPRGKQNIICGQRPICWGTLFGTFCQKTRVTSWYMQMRTWSPEPNG